MTVLSDVQIIEGLLSGQVICRPLRPENIRSSSIDLTLGEWFWRCDARPGGVFNPYDENEVKRYFAGPFQAKPYASVWRKMREIGETWDWPNPKGYSSVFSLNDHRQGSFPNASPFKGVPDDWPVIVLRPRERILAHCHEFVGIKAPFQGKIGGTSMMKARSSSGRVGFKVCDDAGWGDIGFFSRWTMEMRNDNDEAIIIPVGERVAQLVLMQTGAVRVGESYGTATLYEDKYQNTDDIDRLQAEWVPEMMLPRAFKDERRKLLPVDDSGLEQLRRQVARQERERMEELHRKGSESVL